MEANPKDYVTMYQLALLEDEIGNMETAVKMYEELLNASFFESKEEIDFCKKVENYYNDLGNKEMSFKYTIKISRLDTNNIIYAIKVGNILGKEGNYLLACDYFNKALLSKNDFSIEDIKTAIFCFFKTKEYKKCIVFLEELYKRIYKDKDCDDYAQLSNLQKSLISMYILSDELNIARSFVDQILIEKNNDENHVFYIDKIYLYILYKVIDNEKFKEWYDKIYIKYKINNYDKNYYTLILDYCFYSYFLKDMGFSIRSFEILNSFNLPELKVYNIDSILKYLSEINNATSQLNKLRNAMKLDNSKNDNYEKYVEKEDIENWEAAIDFWEGSFIDIDYRKDIGGIENR